MKINKLTARKVQTATIGKYSDGGGLWLKVRTNGSRAWVFRYTFVGRPREMGLGPVESVPLAMARRRAQTAREMVAAGRDPIEARRAHRAAPTFREAAERYIERNEAGWNSARHRAQWKSSLERLVYPIIGDMTVDQIRTAEVLRVLDPLWASKTETGSRVRGRVEVVLDAETVLGHRSGPNPARWRGSMKSLFPKPKSVRRVRHFAALDYREVPAFVAKLEELDGIAVAALEFVVMTCCRSKEARLAVWDEFDLDAGTWTVPGARMKRGEEHKAPLSDEVVDLLRGLPRFGKSKFVFPSTMKAGRPISETLMLRVVRGLDPTITVHGFRASFVGWASEETSFPNIVVEAALAHSVGDKTAEAYHRSDLIEKRRKLMQVWSTYCTTPPAAAGEVVPIRGSA